MKCMFRLLQICILMHTRAYAPTHNVLRLTTEFCVILCLGIRLYTLYADMILKLDQNHGKLNYSTI